MSVSNSEVASNIFWRYAERMLAQAVSFIVSLILARILSPDDYGTIALILVLINILDTFTSKGFNQALIQKKEVDQLDYSTIFLTNTAISVALYALIYFAAPAIAGFYNDGSLIILTRVLAVRILFSGLNAVQQAYVQRNMIFKKFFLATFAGTSISGVAGIIMALMGCGIWALVAQSVLNTAIDTLVLFFTIDWKPRIEYSFHRLKSMMRFGINMLIMGLLESLYNEMRSLVIGKFYKESDLAYYNRGEQIPKLVIQNIQISASNVMFSALSREAQKNAVKDKMREYLRIMFFIIFPLMVGLSITAEPLITILFSNKWLNAVPYMVIYCYIYTNWIIQIPLMQSINAIGRTDVSLKLSILHRIAGVAFLIILLKKGTIYIAVSALIADIFITIVCLAAVNYLYRYTIKEFVSDLWKTAISALCMAAIVFLSGLIVKTVFLKLVVQVITGIGSYMILSKLLKNENFDKLKSVAFKLIKR